MNKILIVGVPEEKDNLCTGCLFYVAGINCMEVAKVMEIAGLGDCSDDHIIYQIAQDNTDWELPQFLQNQAS